METSVKEFEQFHSSISFLISYNENEEDKKLFNTRMHSLDNPKACRELRLAQAKRIYELYKDHKEWIPLENIEIRLIKLKNHSGAPANNIIIYGFENGIFVNKESYHKLFIQQRDESENIGIIASSIIDESPFNLE